MADYLEALDKGSLLTCISDKKRVDELPRLMEVNPDTAILVEHAKDCAFQFFAVGYGLQPMYALTLDCDEKVSLEIAQRSKLRFMPEMVATTLCKEMIVKYQATSGTHPRATLRTHPPLLL